MWPYIFAVIAFVLLLPIVLFLPMSFTRQGKLIIISVSFLLSIIGLLSKQLFSLWQTALILFLLIVSATYLLNKRYAKIMVEKEVLVKDETTKRQIVFDLVDDFHKKSKQVFEHIPLVPAQPEETNDEVFDKRHLEEEASDAHHVNKNTALSSNLLAAEQYEVYDELDSASFMMDDDVAATIEDVPDFEQIPTNVKSPSEDFIDVEYEFNSLFGDVEQQSVEEVQSPTGNSEEVQMTGASEADLFIAEEQELELEQVELSTSPEQDLLRGQIFHIVFAQIKLLKNQLSAFEYEKLIKSNLRNHLSEQEYFSFLSLLIEHYIIEHKYQELCQLIKEQEGKFINQPIISQEFQYLLEKYREKQRNLLETW